MTQNEMPKIETITPPEQGRSMVEMLGTLAIMGVLSIGGIAGYNYAIDKYRANETIDELNSRAIVYATQLENGDLLSGTILRNGEFGDRTSLGYRISATVSEYENEFNVAVNGVPFEVCEQILKNYTIPTEISVNGNIYNDMDENIDICGEGDTNMIFAFNGDLSNDWESVEVSGEPNNGETTAIMTETGSYSYTESTTGTSTITQTPTVTKTGTVLEVTKICSSNANCNNGEFCYLFKEYSGFECSISLEGQCMPIGDYKTYKGWRWAPQNLERKMDWQSAKNWCEAQGLPMVTYSEVRSLGVSVFSQFLLDNGYWLDGYLTDTEAYYITPAFSQEISLYCRSKEDAAVGGLYALCGESDRGTYEWETVTETPTVLLEEMISG